MKLLMRSAEKIISAFNGTEAVELACKEKPDLILMDLRMPVLDGFETTALLKGSEETQDIPIVAVTAQAMSEDEGRCYQAGADGFVTKPIDIEVFRPSLRKVLSK